jgi:hypothetical protein
MSASERRKAAKSEVLVLTSTNFPPEQHQTLLNAVKKIDLPSGASALLTSMASDKVVRGSIAELRAPASRERIDEVLARYGSEWSLLSQCMEELGLHQDERSRGQRSRSPMCPEEGKRALSPTKLDWSGERFAEHVQPVGRASRVDGVLPTAGRAGFCVDIDALAVPAFVCDPSGKILEVSAALLTLT